MTTDEMNALLFSCLNQLEALNNSGCFTHSEALRDRLKVALGLPVEPAVCEDEESEEYEPNVYDGTYSEA